jgi:molecular chaperone HtpG
MSVHSFKAETKEILNLVVHSLYSHREIFLRELISNASDAIEKRRLACLQAGEAAPEFEIRLIPDKEKQTLTITDNGIGMSETEVVQNLGTIAHSGTKAFTKEESSAKDLIGQFGVGFYSSFMVASQVRVETQRAGESVGVAWESDGVESYSTESFTRKEGAGTSITLFLRPKAIVKEEEDPSEMDFLDAWTLKRLVKQYSDFIAYPIRLVHEGEEVLNSMQALWKKDPQEVTDEEKATLYRTLSKDWNEPLKTLHFSTEGNTPFTAMLFLPKERPFDFDREERREGLSLYVQRVLIKEEVKELIPRCLRFVRGLIDAEGLSLNVSRELLQQDVHLHRIRRIVAKKTIRYLQDLLQKDRPTFEILWDAFGTTLKEGPLGYELQELGVEQSSLEQLFLFASDQHEEKTTLQAYVDRMKPEQTSIYYLTGENLERLKRSPYLEAIQKKGFEVLLMVDRIDGFLMQRMKEYQGKPFALASSSKLNLGSNQEERSEDLALCSILKTHLGERVKEVRISKRLQDSPVCLVTDSEEEMSAHMEQILRKMGQSVPESTRILEINPQHMLFASLKCAPESKQKAWTEILYTQAALAEGSVPDQAVKLSDWIMELTHA